MRPKIALVLGGGGSRGLAHIGVLQILQREQVPINSIVATSMGGIIGVLFSLGFSLDDIAAGMQATLSLNDPQGSTLRNVELISSRARQRRVRQHLNQTLGDKTFADLKIPVTLMAVDMIKGKEVALSEGLLVPALLATSAVPGVFPPVNMKEISEINEMNGVGEVNEISQIQLADGGVIDSLATHIAIEQGADKIIAVDVYPELETENPWNDPLSAIMGFQLPSAWFNNNNDTEKVKRPNIISSMWRAVRVMTWHLHQKRLADHPPDILLRPNVDAYGSLDFKDTTGPIQAGVAEAEQHLAAFQALRDTCV